MPYEFEREHYRIQYPTAAQPRAILAGRAYVVLDLSEQGMRCRLEKGMTHTLGEELEGVVHFRRGEDVPVRGLVVRMTELDIAVRLSVGIPFRVILDEQRYLREHHRGSAW